MSQAGRSPLPILVCDLPGISLSGSQYLKKNEDFNFHPKCGGLKITHLAFADDLVLLSRGDPTLVALLMEILNHFGDCSGLRTSFAKSNISQQVSIVLI